MVRYAEAWRLWQDAFWWVPIWLGGQVEVCSVRVRTVQFGMAWRLWCVVVRYGRQVSEWYGGVSHG